MKVNRYVQRTFAWIFWSVFNGLGFCLLFWMLFAKRDPYGFLALIYPVFAFLMLALILYEYPKVAFDRKGVHVKMWFCTRFYPWGDICQVGISSFFRTWYYTNRLVLVRTGCSKRGYRDFMFHLRNLGKLIYLPAKPDMIAFVRSCYGPLDFNLPDGKIEESIIMDVTLNTVDE